MKKISPGVSVMMLEITSKGPGIDYRRGQILFQTVNILMRYLIHWFYLSYM